jgi:methylenetetrahydrofolate reductase (NADPH)
LSVGDHPDASAADDLTVGALIRLGTTLRGEGRLLSGHQIDEPPRYYVGVADSPLAHNYDPARLEAKLDAGGAFVVTQITYDLDALLEWVDVVRARGVLERAAVLVGVAPIRSAKQAHFLNDQLPGVSVPQSMLAAFDDATETEAEVVGTAQCVELVTRLRAVPGIAGVHVIGLGREDGVRRVIERAGLLPRPWPGRGAIPDDASR